MTCEIQVKTTNNLRKKITNLERIITKWTVPERKADIAKPCVRRNSQTQSAVTRNAFAASRWP